MQVGAVIFSPGEIVNFSNVEADEVISRGFGYLMMPKAINKPPVRKIARHQSMKQISPSSRNHSASPLEE